MFIRSLKKQLNIKQSFTKPQGQSDILDDSSFFFNVHIQNQYFWKKYILLAYRVQYSI